MTAISRRRALLTMGRPLPWLMLAAVLRPSSAAGLFATTSSLSAADERLLQEIQERAFRYFWEAASPHTGLVRDRSRADGREEREVASIAATGFGLTALCIAHQRGIAPARRVIGRVKTTLRYLWKHLPQHHGFFFHFVNVHTGKREWQSELSSIDTGLLLCGVLTCGAYFEDDEIRDLAQRIYGRVDWHWMLHGGKTLSHGWKPESGFLPYRWDHYSELMLIYLLALGSPVHPIPAESWHAWERPRVHYKGIQYIGSSDPLFVHQYSHAWFDFRNKRDACADYFENSAKATRAHKLFCLDLRDQYPWFSERLWGITASDSMRGYVVWGGPPAFGPIDGTVVPCAAGGSLPFLPRECLDVLHEIRRLFPKAWRRYGFVDAFHPGKKWFNPDVIGIDVGITMLMAENARTGMVWQTFMKNEAARKGMQRAGFQG